MQRQWKLSVSEITQAVANFVQRANNLPSGTACTTALRAWNDAAGDHFEATVTLVEPENTPNPE